MSTYTCSPGGSSGSSQGDHHGGDIDPFAISFDREDGIPTQTIHCAQTGTVTPLKPLSPSTKSQSIKGIFRKPFGSRTIDHFSTVKSEKSNNDDAFNVVEISQANTPIASTFIDLSQSTSSVPNPLHRSFGTYDVDLEAVHKEGDSNYHVPRTFLGGYISNFFSRTSRYRVVKSPHSFQKPGIRRISDNEYRHQDNLQRIYIGQLDDRFINPENARVNELVVQCTDRVYRGPKNSTYKRTFIRNIAPKTLRVANWPMDHLDHRPQNSKGWGYFLMVVKWPITCCMLYFIIGIPGIASMGEVVNGGCYDSFPYRYWGYCKVTRNAIEESASNPSNNITYSPEDGTYVSDMPSNRILEPIYLCFLTGRKHPDTGEELGERLLVSDWKEDPANKDYHGKCPEYLFIAYTSDHFNHGLGSDIQALHVIATKATKEAGLIAYWVGASCMQSGNGLEDDVYRISDIVRGAHSLVIAIGPGDRDTERQSTMQSMLRCWGERLWTLPEALLITQNQPITVYHRGDDKKLVLSKKQLAALAWADSKTTRQLVDHYEGNLTLSRLELVIIALESLFVRKTNKQYLPGDQSYALMGLLRLRPKIDHTDSAFQALARLSLANDNDMLLERLMCILPQNQDQHWSSVSDAYGAKLWDIYPTCQIAGVCEDDSVIIDGAFGATIHWDRFRKVANARRVGSWKRLTFQIALHGAPHALTIGLIILKIAHDAKSFFRSILDETEKLQNAFRKVASVINSAISHAIGWLPENTPPNISSQLKEFTSNITQVVNDVSSGLLGDEHTEKVAINWAEFIEVIGFLLLIIAVIIFVTAPYITRMLYRGKFWGTQAWLFGFEGYADLETIESQIFGSRMRRLRWSTYGSPLSRHCKNEFHECVGVDPTTDPKVRQKVEEAITNTKSNAMRIFTVVDTNTMTVTMFEAVRPPVAVLLCGSEGGMQRAIACSYQWTTGTCYRETVLRMETTVLEKMSRVSRFRFGMKRV